ncbi:MAG TPA: autotransporter-associated beta strand repeat-containing protein [Verrucomicrobiae bacterium]|nr:autotransporter-associated beta strand repeat-containing protein [Verrucomicrobiae bacterium]
MKKILFNSLLFSAGVILFGVTQPAGAAGTSTWSGAGADLNWATAGNWSAGTGASAPPAAADTAVFGNGAFPASTNGVGLVNAVVAANATVATLTFQNISPQAQTVQVSAGQTLVSSGALNIGSGVAAGSTTYVTINGPGELDVNGAVSLNGTGGASDSHMELNMAGLGTFKNLAAATTMNIGTGTQMPADLSLASNSIVNVATLNIETTAGNNGRAGNLNLGATTNTIYASAINISTGKGATAKIQFTNSTGTVAMGGTGGGTARTTMLLGNGSSGSAVSHGQLLLAGHLANVLAGTVTMGAISGSDTGTGDDGIVTFDHGTFDATSILMGNTTTSSSGKSSSGTFTVGGDPANIATLIVNAVGGGKLVLGNTTTANESGIGILNINQNGVVQPNCSITKANAAQNTATLNINQGTLILAAATNTVGTTAVPIDNVSLSDATNNFTASSTVNMVVNNLSTGGSGNTINISSVPVVTSYPQQFPLIQFAGGIGGNGFNFVLGTLPASLPAYQGYISNNVSSVDLVLTSGPMPMGLDVWNGTANANWDTTTSNWTNTGVATVFRTGDAVQFDDTATGSTTVNLTTTLVPGTMVISNFTKLYTFNGPGRISGGTGLTKAGNSTLILDNSGINDFIGAITISGGTLQAGNNDANGSLPVGNIQDDSALALSRTDNVTLPNLISGAGTLAQNGSGKLTLTGANNYSGNTSVRNGTLALSGAGAIASSPQVAVSDAGTFDVSGITGTAFNFNAITLTNGTLALGTKTATITTLAASNSTISLIADANAVTLATGSLTTGGTTNFINITAVYNVPTGPALPVVIPLITYTAGTFSGGFNFGETGFANAYVSNDVATSTVYLVLIAAPYVVTWNGGSGTGNNWSDAANWTGVNISSRDSLFFDGSTRVNNNNDTAAGTLYTNLTFNSGAGAFTLSGNPINLGGAIINNSPNPQTILLGLDYNGNRTLNGASGLLIIGGGLTNTLGTSGSTTLTLAGTGILTNLLSSTSNPGGTNLMLLNDAAANWTLMDNAASATMTVPWALAINNGTFNFGSAISAPKLTSSSAQGLPQDNQIGTANGGTGTLNMSNGTYTTTARINTGVGGGATGIINLSGGTLNVGSQFQGANGANTAFSTVTISGGTMNIGSAATPTGTFFVASRGAGTLNMNGGVLNCGTLDTSRNAAGNTGGSTGLVNLNGGLLTVTAITNISASSQTGGSPTAQINYNGGTLRARASFTYLGNPGTPTIPITSLVQTGGAIIDTTNFNISFLEPLQTDPGLSGATDGGLLKLGSGTLTLGAANTYIGNTVVSNGTLAVSGSLGQTVVRVAGGTLSGTGSVGDDVTIQANGAISPAGAGVTGTFSITGNLVLQGTTAMDINQGTATSDTLSVSGAVTYGGTLAVTNLSGTLTTNDTFTLFSAASYAGTFAAITPATPGAGLAWNTNTLTTDGVLRLVAQPVNPVPTKITAVVTGNTLTLSWPADHTGWRLQVQTNSLNRGLNANWSDVAGSTTVHSVGVTINPVNGTVFYRMVYP